MGQPQKRFLEPDQLKHFSFKFLQQSCVSAGPDSSLWTSSHQPLWPYTGQLSLWFSMGLCTWSCSGHMIKMKWIGHKTKPEHKSLL